MTLTENDNMHAFMPVYNKWVTDAWSDITNGLQTNVPT